METADTTEVMFYAFAWLVAFLSGVSRTLHNGNFVNYRNCIYVGLVAGFLGFAIVAILIRGSSNIHPYGAYWLGVSCIVGLSGKESVAIITTLTTALTAKATQVINSIFGGKDG